MEMESSSFPWDCLPVNLQETILSLLPISTLIRCTAVSRSLRSVVQSPSFLSSYRNNPHPNPYFLFSRPGSTIGPAYDPLLDRWISLPTPPDSTSSVWISDGGLLLLHHSCSPNLIVSQPFLHRLTHRVPNPLVLFPVALIADESPEHFKIVALSKIEPIRWLVYDSRSGEWETKGQFSGSLPLRTSVANGILYCLTCGANSGGDRLFTFDPAAGGSQLELGHVNLPSAVRSLHTLAFSGRLFLAGREEDPGRGEMVGIGIWEMDWARMEWRVHCVMPEDVFSKFAAHGLGYCHISARKGIVCCVSYKPTVAVYVLMCDLLTKRWWRPRVWEGMNQGKAYCVAHAVEPHIGLLRWIR